MTMKLAILKNDFYFLGDARISGGVLPKGTTIQVSNHDITIQLYGRGWFACNVLHAPGGLVSFVEKDELDNVVEFLDDETGDT